MQGQAVGSCGGTMQQPGCSSWGSFRKLDSASWIPQMRAVLVVTWDEIDAMTAGLAGEQVGDRGATPQGQVRRGQSADGQWVCCVALCRAVLRCVVLCCAVSCCVVLCCDLRDCGVCGVPKEGSEGSVGSEAGI
mmetsp:Transcript_1817/g.4062  ORF Transcript_1817/g.4062 Transcript_1817/m.4062 type:complete len:134 (-) Transcript_1817:705-1106(-)